MNNHEYQLAPKISYRLVSDFAVLLDHGSGDILRLNPAAGRVVAAIDTGDRALTADEREFAEELTRREHVTRAGCEPTGASATADDPAGKGAVLERINRDAAARLIPLHCQLEITYRCSLRCRHCYIPPGAADTAIELSLDEIRSLLDRLAELGTLFLLLTGGEPFARPDLEEIFHAARDRRFAVSLLTSGTGADREVLERMAARGVDSLQVSIYGPDAATHDRLTGIPGSFDAALTCLRAARDLGVRTRAGVTLTRLSAGRLPEIKTLLAHEGLPLALGLYLEPRRDGSREPQSLAIDERDLRAALTAFPPRDPPRLRDRSLTGAPCDAGANTLAIDPSGAVFPCLSLRRRIGSIREAKIDRIWNDSKDLERLRSIRVADLEGCPECENRTSCNRCVGFAVSEGLGLLEHAPLDCVQARVQTLIEGLG